MVNDFAKELEKELKSYHADITKQVAEACEDEAKKAVAELKRTSPYLYGDYSRNWDYQKNKNGVVVYNYEYGWLTHILEYGHAKANGGRVSGITHIKPVEQKAINGLINRIEKVGGGE